MLSGCFFFSLVLGSSVTKPSGRLSRDCLEEHQGVFVINYFGILEFCGKTRLTPKLKETSSQDTHSPLSVTRSAPTACHAGGGTSDNVAWVVILDIECGGPQCFSKLC